jgi:DNA replication protein DnaC
MTTETLREPHMCAIHGTVMPNQFFCRDCSKEADEKNDLERAIAVMQARLNSTRVPSRYHDNRLNDFVTETPAQESVMDTVRNYIWNFPDSFCRGRCLSFIGGVGTGKTLLASAMLQTLVGIAFPTERKNEYSPPGRIYRAKYVTAPELVRQVRDTWTKDAKVTTTEVIQSFAGTDLLVIDEVGAGVGTASELSLLAEIVDLRYQARRPTIAISNLGRPGLIAALGEPGVDRLRDNGGDLCLFNWGSYRK